MKHLHFDYCMEISYSHDVTNCHYTIKCIPQDTSRQKVTHFQIEMLPPSKPEWSYDSLGNRYIFGCNPQPHTYFKYRITGDVETGKTDCEGIATENEQMIYRHSHGLTVPGERLTAYYDVIKNSISDFEAITPLEKAKGIMGFLRQNFTYEKEKTTFSTTAEEAFTLGCGVCQDYAHILISLLNLAGCSARYVTGLIIGEGASHAWVEVVDGGKWYGIDPTNGSLVGEDYIKIGAGRDASECQLNRGIMHGGGDQKQEISVSVTEVSPGQKFLRKGALL